MSRTAISFDEAVFYANQKGKAQRFVSNRAETYHDDGTSITMQMKEFLAGVPQYSTFFDAGRHEHFTLQVEGEDFATVMPFNSVAQHRLGENAYPVVRITEKSVAKKVFEAIAQKGTVALSHDKKIFGVLVPLVAPEIEPA